MSRRFVLLDHDGTINVERKAYDILDPPEIRLLPGALDGPSELVTASANR